MRNILVVIIFFFGLSTNAQSTGEYLRDLSKRKFTWLVEKKYDSLANLLDEKLMYIHSNGWIESKNEVLTDIQTGKLIYNSVEVLESDVRVFESSAIVTGRGNFNVVVQGNPVIIKLLYTEVYVLKDNKWKLVSRHANKL